MYWSVPATAALNQIDCKVDRRQSGRNNEIGSGAEVEILSCHHDE